MVARMIIDLCGLWNLKTWSQVEGNLGGQNRSCRIARGNPSLGVGFKSLWPHLSSNLLSNLCFKFYDYEHSFWNSKPK